MMVNRSECIGIFWYWLKPSRVPAANCTRAVNMELCFRPWGGGVWARAVGSCPTSQGPGGTWVFVAGLLRVQAPEPSSGERYLSSLPEVRPSVDQKMKVAERRFKVAKQNSELMMWDQLEVNEQLLKEAARLNEQLEKETARLNEQLLKERAQLKRESREAQCVICQDAKPSKAFVPCGHVCICASCWPDFVRNSGGQLLCPTCRQGVKFAHNVFL
eukprot:Skav218151  [mRNA]  locus=scaffold2428:47235:53376:- [translate_table: standard]